MDAGETPDVTDPGQDASALDDAVTDPPPPPPDSGPPTEGLPPFDDATVANVRELVSRGRARGNRHNVFAKIGDSITESASFLSDCGFGWYVLGEYTDLEPTIRYFTEVTIENGRNSYNRYSVSAVAGWTASMALEGHPDSPLARELAITQPQWALIMYGTNDLERVDVETYRANLLRVIDVVLERDVVPVISTIPARLDGEPYASRVPVFNDAVRSIAAERHIPLMDYWAALVTAPRNGISSDGVHPSLYRHTTSSGQDGCEFNSESLQYGYNVRNFLALRMLTRLRAY